jgi:hypothetical protein
MGQDYPPRGPRRDFNGNRGSGFNRRPGYDQPGLQRERVADEILGERVIETERKIIKLTHRRNPGGEFLRIDESRHGNPKNNCVIIPLENVEAVFDALENLFPAPAQG